MANKFKFILFILCTTLLLGETRPKIGLVLSGGGGKGFSHIGALRVLEREQIPIDYISGSSIGAIVGLLYSIGYNVDELEEIIYEIDWDNVFSEKPNRIDRPMEEKLFSERYLTSLPVEGLKVKLPKGLISGQNIYNILKEYTWAARGIKDFDNLPIPFRAVATNLATGDPVILDNGDIARALNASMAIPTFFQPIEWNGLILTDGLSSKNFPVDEAIAMGADIIIGVDIGAPLANVSDLSFLGVLNQVQAFRGYDSTLEQRAKADYLIEPDISMYSPIDFNKRGELIALGEEAAEKILPQIRHLSDPVAFNKRRSLIPPKNIDSRAIINYIEFEGLNKVEEDFVYTFFDSKPPFSINQFELNDIVKNMQSIGFFHRIYYEINGDILLLSFEEKEENYINIGLNYTSKNGANNANIILSTTLNSFGMKGSKTIFDLVVSQHPKLYINNFLYYGIGTFGKLGLISSFAFDRDITFSYGLDGLPRTELRYNDLSLDFLLGTIIGRRSLSGFGLSIDNTFYEENQIRVNRTYPRKREESYSFYFKSRYDSYNKANYPSSGSAINLELRASLDIFNIQDNTDFYKTSLYAKRYIELSDHLSFNAKFAYSTLSGDKIPWKYQNVIKGSNPHNDIFSFHGVNNKGVQIDDFLSIGFGFQIDLGNDFYLNIMKNSLSYEDNNSDIKLLSGYGFSIGYDSFLGPIDLTLTNDVFNKGNVLYTFSLGYSF